MRYNYELPIYCNSNNFVVLLTFCVAPIQNPSLKSESKDYILPKPKPKINND